MPHVLPSDAEKFPLYKSIESKVSLPIAYRTRQCDTITVPQATLFAWRLAVKKCSRETEVGRYWISDGKAGDETKNPAIFDHASLKNMYVTLNSTRYPAVDYNLSFANQQFWRAYGDASLFGVKSFGMDELITRSNISPVDYKGLFPLFVFDVSKQSEKLKSSVVDVQIRAIFNEAVPAGTQAYAVVISDKLSTFQSDGSKMSVVY